MAWKKSLILIKSVYSTVSTFPPDEKWALTSQIKRAAVSVAANIAEGSSKRSTREFIRFLNISYGSLSELEALLTVALELGFISDQKFAPLAEQCIEVGKILNGLIKSLALKLETTEL